MAFALLTAFVSCQHQYPAGLVEVDSLLCQNPQLAASKLRSFGQNVDSQKLDDYNYWRLLSLMVKERTYQPIGSSETLEKLISYYDGKHEEINLAKACYLQGRLMQEYHEYPLALSYFHRSLKMLDLQDNQKLRGLVNSQIGSILLDLGLASQSAEYYKKAFESDSIVSDVRGMILDIRDLSIVYIEQGNVSAALQELHAALSMVQKSEQKDLANDVKLQIANVHLYGTDQLDSVWTYLSPSLQNSRTNSISAYLAAAEYYWALYKDDSTKYYLGKVINRGNVFQKSEAYKRLISISSYENDLRSIDVYSERYILLNDSISKIKEREQKLKGRDILKFLDLQDEIELLQKSNSRKSYLSLLFLLLLLLIIVVFVIYYHMNVVRKLKVKNKIANIKLLAFSSDARRMDKHQSICEKLQLDMYVKSKKCLRGQTWGELDKEVNVLYPNFKDRLYSCYKLSDFEYQVCMLVKIGISTTQIAILTAHAKTSVSMAKQRLYGKLTAEKGKAEDLNRLLLYF